MRVLVHNLAIEYQDDGTGPVLLFLHGWKDSLHTFDAVSALLKEQYRIIRLDLPGFGESEMPREPWHLDDFVSIVKEFVQKLHLDVDVLVGHSLGGRIAIKAVSEKMVQPNKLVLIATAGIAKSRSVRSRTYMIIAKIGKLITSAPPLRPFRYQLRKKLYAGTGSDYPDAGELKKTLLNIIHEDLRTAASQIRIPTLLIWGSADSVTPLQDGRLLARSIPNALLEVIDGAEHLVHQEQPQQVAELIRQFAS